MCETIMMDVHVRVENVGGPDFDFLIHAQLFSTSDRLWSQECKRVEKDADSLTLWCSYPPGTTGQRFAPDWEVGCLNRAWRRDVATASQSSVLFETVVRSSCFQNRVFTLVTVEAISTHACADRFISRLVRDQEAAVLTLGVVFVFPALVRTVVQTIDDFDVFECQPLPLLVHKVLVQRIFCCHGHLFVWFDGEAPTGVLHHRLVVVRFQLVSCLLLVELHPHAFVDVLPVDDDVVVAITATLLMSQAQSMSQFVDCRVQLFYMGR